jgi:NAD(P)-dependent dehydrogenase (short-subunit alcohol dehydrogenase family)
MNRPANLEGRTALVTGGAGGLGHAIASALAAAGARVLISGRRAEDCQRAARQVGGKNPCTPIVGDLVTAKGVRDVADQVGGETDRLHVLVNNAGTVWAASLGEFPLHGWDKVIDLNLRAPFLLTQALLPLLEASSSTSDPARIVNIGSMEGLRVADQDNYSYSASKAGLHHLTRVLARELGSKQITVNAVAPGIIETRMTRALRDQGDSGFRARTPLGRFGTPSDVAEAVSFLAGPGGAFITGAILPVDGGLSMTL